MFNAVHFKQHSWKGIEKEFALVFVFFTLLGPVSVHLFDKNVYRMHYKSRSIHKTLQYVPTTVTWWGGRGG